MNTIPISFNLNVKSLGFTKKKPITVQRIVEEIQNSLSSVFKIDIANKNSIDEWHNRNKVCYIRYAQKNPFIEDANIGGTFLIGEREFKYEITRPALSSPVDLVRVDFINNNNNTIQ